MANKKPTLKEFAAMCKAKSANISNIATGLNTSRMSIYNWMEKSPKFKEAFEDVRESLLDFTESQQLLLIRGVPKKDEEGKFEGWVERPSETMIIWFEKTRGKHRGYTEKSEIDHTTGGKELAAPQLIFCDTPLSEKDLQEIREIEQGVKAVKNEETSQDSGISKT